MVWNSDVRRAMMAVGTLVGILSAGMVQAGPFSDRPVTIGQESTASEGSETTVPAAGDAVSSGEAVSPASETTSDREYSVKKGDYLSDIARRLLGDASRYQEIVRLNVDRYPSLAKNPNLILVGWELRLPGSSDTRKKAPAPVVTAGRPTQTPTPSNSTAVAATPNSVSSQAPQSGALASTQKPASSEATEPVAAPSTDGAPLIGPGERVLHIGDSHTVGIYGSTIDDAMRKTGAQIRTYGVAGSSPSWWYQGTVTKCGYYGRDEKGKVDRPADWRTPRATPSLPDLIREYKPTVLVVSLGANLFGASEATVKRETQRIIDTAKAAGCTLVWVGPPRARENVKSIAAQDRLCETIKSTVGTQGTFVDSRPFTKYPSGGGDGLHYWGTEGTKTAKNWASSVLDTIQKSGKQD